MGSTATQKGQDVAKLLRRVNDRRTMPTTMVKMPNSCSVRRIRGPSPPRSPHWSGESTGATARAHYIVRALPYSNSRTLASVPMANTKGDRCEHLLDARG